jgi:hypothetical protein
VKYTRMGSAAAGPRRIVSISMLLVALALSSCGEDSGAANGPTVAQRVTTEFGHNLISSEDDAPLEGHETMMRLVDEYNDVRTSYKGKVVESIDGRRMDSEKGTSTWASFVNGVETDPYPNEYKLFAGDLVQWDLRDWYITLDVRATVGAFPEFFTRGFEGRRIPMRVLCEDRGSAACTHVKRVLRRAGVPLDEASGRPTEPIQTSTGKLRLAGRVLVGKWEHWRDRVWPKRIDRGPRFSGVFARFSPDGDELRLLDWNAHFARAERGDVGLVAAMRPTEADFMWLVTGLNDKGVLNAARALDRDRLRDAYTLAVLPDGDEKLPLEPPS